MIINKLIEKIFSAPSNISVLRVLNERVIGISGREIARLSDISTRAAQTALLNLEEIGLVNRVVGGREHLFSLNRDHYLSEKLIHHIFQSEKEFKKNIYSLIKKELGKLSTSIIVFGSVARGESTVKSDLDICLVLNNKINSVEKKLSILRDELFNKFSVSIAPFYISEKDFKQKYKNKSEPIVDIINDGKVISGKEIRDLIK